MGRALRMALLYFALAFLSVCSAPEHPTDTNPETTGQYADLPDILQLQSNRSDQFLVDISTISAGHPFKGRRANTPHQGAHVHWDNSANAWPQGGSGPSNYPALYAVADGYVDSIDETFPVGANDRYGVSLAIARSGTSIYLFCYGIEPMVPEPSQDFYKSFILVSQGQKVQKGQKIAYMYLPPNAGIGCHIHFHLQQKGLNNFLAPAVFQDSVVDSFHAQWSGFGLDGSFPMPSCMGYMLDADENPFGTAAVDILK